MNKISIGPVEKDNNHPSGGFFFEEVTEKVENGVKMVICYCWKIFPDGTFLHDIENDYE